MVLRKGGSKPSSRVYNNPMIALKTCKRSHGFKSITAIQLHCWKPKVHCGSEASGLQRNIAILIMKWTDGFICSEDQLAPFQLGDVHVMWLANLGVLTDCLIGNAVHERTCYLPWILTREEDNSSPYFGRLNAHHAMMDAHCMRHQESYFLCLALSLYE